MKSLLLLAFVLAAPDAGAPAARLDAASCKQLTQRIAQRERDLAALKQRHLDEGTAPCTPPDAPACEARRQRLKNLEAMERTLEKARVQRTEAGCR